MDIYGRDLIIKNLNDIITQINDQNQLIKNELNEKINVEIKKLKINFFAKLETEIKKLDSKFIKDSNVVIQKRSIDDDVIKTKIKELEDKLNVFTIKDDFVSVNNRRIVDLNLGTDGNDAITLRFAYTLSDMLENKINRVEEKLNSLPIDQFGPAI